MRGHLLKSGICLNLTYYELLLCLTLHVEAEVANFHPERVLASVLEMLAMDITLPSHCILMDKRVHVISWSALVSWAYRTWESPTLCHVSRRVIWNRMLSAYSMRCLCSAAGFSRGCLSRDFTHGWMWGRHSEASVSDYKRNSMPTLMSKQPNSPLDDDDAWIRHGL